MGYDRNEVLGRTDLAELADQLVGPRKGRGAGATWPCPDPGHGNQTGKTPPVSIFRTGYGDERWRCHSCGAGGTAIDLVMTTQGVRFPEAIELLARRAGVAEVDRPIAALRTARIQRPEPAAPSRPSAEVERFVAAAEAHLWSEQGRPMRRWLAERGLGEEVLRANRVGADPGPTALDRPRGLPRGGPAVVLPVLGPDGEATYLQSRYLSPNGHKYDNPSAALAGGLPRTAEVRLPRPPADPGLVVVSEGIPDALVAAQAGYRAAAVLGAGVPDERTAAALVERFPTERLVVAFDADGPGQAGAERLQELLAERGAGDRVSRLEVPTAAGDLNGWQQLAGPSFGEQLAEAIAARTTTTTEMERSMAVDPSPAVPSPPPAAAPVREPEPVTRHGLYAAQGNPDSTLAAAIPADASTGVYVALSRRGALPEGPVVAPEPRAALGLDNDGLREAQAAAARQVAAEWAKPDLLDRLEAIRYQHVLVDDPQMAAASVARVEQATAYWTTATVARIDGAVDQPLPHPTNGLPPAPTMAELDERLESLAYRHVLVDDPYLAQLNLDTTASTVREWSTDLGRSVDTELAQADIDPDLAGAQRWAFDHGLTHTPDLTSAVPVIEPPALDGLGIDM
jgi:hypothetical protein